MASPESSKKQILETARTCIEFSSLAKVKADKIGIDANCVLNPSKDWQKLKSYARVCHSELRRIVKQFSVYLLLHSFILNEIRH